MFGIGIPELIIIMILALIVIGPEKLPDIAKTLGKAMSEFKNVVEGVKTTMEAEQRNIEKDLDEKPASSYAMNLSDKEKELKKDYDAALSDKEEELKKESEVKATPKASKKTAKAASGKSKESSTTAPKPKKVRKAKLKDETVKEV